MNSYKLFATILTILVVSSEGRIGVMNVNYSPFRMSINSDNCQIRSYGLKTVEDVQNAIDKARDGEVIRLDPIVYEGNLYINGKNNNKFITLLGDHQCNENTKFRGQVSIKDSKKWIINAFVFEDTDNAVDVSNSQNIRILNLVMNHINGNAVQVQDSNYIDVENLVIDNVGKNAIKFSNVNEVNVKNSVISNVGGVAIDFDHGQNLDIANNVVRNIVREAIKTSGPSNNVRISSTVINGDSKKGRGWMSLEGNHYSISNTVATGGPKHGIVVMGCNYDFNNNICTLWSRGFCIFLTNRQSNCRNNISITNMNMGGRGLSNYF